MKYKFIVDYKCHDMAFVDGSWEFANSLWQIYETVTDTPEQIAEQLRQRFASLGWHNTKVTYEQENENVV